MKEASICENVSGSARWGKLCKMLEIQVSEVGDGATNKRLTPHSVPSLALSVPVYDGATFVIFPASLGHAQLHLSNMSLQVEPERNYRVSTLGYLTSQTYNLVFV